MGREEDLFRARQVVRTLAVWLRALERDDVSDRTRSLARKHVQAVWEALGGIRIDTARRIGFMSIVDDAARAGAAGRDAARQVIREFLDTGDPGAERFDVDDVARLLDAWIAPPRGRRASAKWTLVAKIWTNATGVRVSAAAVRKAWQRVAERRR